MNKFLAASGLCAALIISGCSRSTAFDFFSSDPYYEKAVSNMQKVSLMKNLETKALLHAVYLNNVDPKNYSEDDYFYVAVHIIDDTYNAEQSGLNNPNYHLRMTKIEASDEEEEEMQKAPRYNRYVQFDAPNKEPVYIYSDALTITELEEDHKLRQTMPVRNQWNHFYLVRYKGDANVSEPMLSFESSQYGTARLRFQKEK